MTIRQLPQNYLLAKHDEGENCFKMDPDLAADQKMVVALTLALLNYENKYVNFPDAIIICAERILERLKLINIDSVL